MPTPAFLHAASGWTAEMAIPFKSLRYPARAEGEPHRWGFQITRRIRGRSEAQSWSPVSRDIAGQLTQFGILEGLEGLSQSRNLEILPELTGISFGSLDRQTGIYNQREPDGDLGMGFKYGITPNLTADFTYNPDFSQIEADRPQIETNQRFALFYPEQRPFFLEGQEIFQIATPMALLNTRTIVDPRFGGKLTGKVGDTTLGVFVADDEAAESSQGLKLRKTRMKKVKIKRLRRTKRKERGPVSAKTKRTIKRLRANKEAEELGAASDGKAGAMQKQQSRMAVKKDEDPDHAPAVKWFASGVMVLNAGDFDVFELSELFWSLLLCGF